MPIFAKLEICRDATPRSAAVNMAIDEALLETAKVPSIRFYRWNSPALSFGYFGKFADVAHYAPRRDLVRRWTGGGIVFHGDDLTYSIVIPANDPAFSESSMVIYEKIHCALRCPYQCMFCESGASRRDGEWPKSCWRSAKAHTRWFTASRQHTTRRRT